MSFEKNFCSSPWLHMRINNSGSFEYCRWQAKPSQTQRVDFDHNIRNQTSVDYFQNTLSPLRNELLSGRPVPGCNDCYKMETHKKVSGRQRQLLKIGVNETQFTKTLLSAPLLPELRYSVDNQGHTNRTPVDWQIDLGNYCNGACVYCSPAYSSRLAAEFKQLGIIHQLPPPSWCDDPELLKKFIDELVSCDNIKYLHFLGGETVITPGFKKILQAIVDCDLAKNITVGFTTNLTVWSDSVIELLKQFQQINLGMSIEALTKVNDYVRYPSELEQTQTILDRWVALGQNLNWLMQLRTTPTCLTIHDLVTVYEYAWQHNLAVESCNFLTDPEFLRITVLPKLQRQLAQTRLSDWISAHPITNTVKIINTRNSNVAREQIVQDAQSYVNLLLDDKDEQHRLPDLMKYLKKLEGSRGNSILNYLPEYESIFRSAGY